jgi:hypothetical protein
VNLLSDDANARALSAALGTQYELVRLLGRGGMGTVYLAREPFLDRDVAVKVLPSDLASGDARERFLREARTAAKLSHPNIVPLYTFGQAGELLYYVMGYVDGESLETRLRRERRLTFDEARRMTSEISDALEYAHQLGVVHRDVKPDNVLLDRHSGRAMLTDFGVAKQRATQETLTQTGVIVGTPHYMSPEQASGERAIDGRSDIYSLGVIAYRMVTGRLPFEGSLMRDVLAQHATRAPVPPAQIIASLPVDLDTVITRALAKDPAERWPNAHAVRIALSPESDESMPDGLRNISEIGVRLGILSLSVGELAFLGSLYGFADPPALWMMGVSAVGVLVAGALGLIIPARRFGWRTTLQTALRQPSWWKTWWPKFGRRTGDVWDRLPAAIRAFRAQTLPMFGAIVPFVNLVLFVLRPSWLGAHPAFLNAGHVVWPTFAVAGALYGSMFYQMFKVRRWRIESGISRNDCMRMMTESTFARSFWARPHIAALLGPPGSPRDTGSVAPTSPRELLREIELLARDGASSPHADLYNEAADAARSLAAAIVNADDELGQLARDADPQEQSRIKESLARTAEPQMRDLLERQLQLFRELDARQEDVRARRDRLVAQLRTLSLQLAHLRAQSAMDSATAAEITGRIHALVRSIDHRIEGVKETRELLSP